MACENCEYWKPSYAPFAHRFVMECTKEERKGEMGGCKYFQKKDPEPSTIGLFRYNAQKND